MNHHTTTVTVFAAAALLGLTTSATAAPPAPQAAYTSMSPEELAEYLVFEAGGFDLDATTQDGSTALERMIQDRTQKVCSAINRSGEELDRATAAKISALAEETIDFPEDGVALGDWKRGEAIARSGYTGFVSATASTTMRAEHLVATAMPATSWTRMKSLRHRRTEPHGLRPAARYQRCHAEPHLQDPLQRAYVLSVHEHAALRPPRHIDAGANH